MTIPFYPGQSFVEEDSFIGVLRTQTKLTGCMRRRFTATWLREGWQLARQSVAGIGDFAGFGNKEITRRGWWRSTIAQIKASPMRRNVANDDSHQGHRSMSMGDARKLCWKTDQFDFVTCRHALQVLWTGRIDPE